ncbi:MAG TPA: hypothetical protein VFX22_06735 [Candidatus Kapabacteria bacterium]|jgi:hypothetical protein|nr:hypothetical protein [Candidatus Kapabacteria bacterium]
MMLKKTLIILVFSSLLMASSSGARAQTSTTGIQAGTVGLFSTNVYGVGLSASLCSGMGLTFRQHFAYNPLAYQITGGVWKTHSLGMYDLGAQIQYDLSLSTNRLYALAGGGYYYYGHTAQELASPARVGLGLGYEMTYANSVGLSLNLLVTVFEPDGDILPLPSLDLLIYFR